MTIAAANMKWQGIKNNADVNYLGNRKRAIQSLWYLPKDHVPQQQKYLLGPKRTCF
jgi:hypothetical protein